VIHTSLRVCMLPFMQSILHIGLDRRLDREPEWFASDPWIDKSREDPPW
jgi:hypothetical protein